MPQLILLFAFVVSAVLTAFVIPKIILISYKKKLFDFADERKVHKGIVPRLGGVAFTPLAFYCTGSGYRTAMVSILLVSVFFAPFNLGLIFLLNINLIVLLDVVLWTLMYIWLMKMIQRRQTRMTSLADGTARYPAIYQGKRLPFRSRPHGAVCLYRRIGLQELKKFQLDILNSGYVWLQVRKNPCAYGVRLLLY